MVSALVRWPVQLLVHLHVPVSAAPSSLCEKANQALPPATPAAFKCKHPVKAHQQLRPQMSRWVSCPRGAAISAHGLWPGRLAPRRVRRQHSKVAVSMLARRWYQWRDPIQKLACANLKLNKSLRPKPLCPYDATHGSRKRICALPTSRPYQSLIDKQLKSSVVRSQEDLRPYAILDINHHTKYDWCADVLRCIDCTCGTWNSIQLIIEAIGCYTDYFYSNPLGAKSPIEFSTASSREIPVLS